MAFYINTRRYIPTHAFMFDFVVAVVAIVVVVLR